MRKFIFRFEINVKIWVNRSTATIMRDLYNYIDFIILQFVSARLEIYFETKDCSARSYTISHSHPLHLPPNVELCRFFHSLFLMWGPFEYNCLSYLEMSSTIRRQSWVLHILLLKNEQLFIQWEFGFQTTPFRMELFRCVWECVCIYVRGCEVNTIEQSREQWREQVSERVCKFFFPFLSCAAKTSHRWWRKFGRLDLLIWAWV